jgi:menaquinone-dependent protoporphyrinogen oxidase
MSEKILVAYASRGSATAGVAEAIGRSLAEAGAQVDVRPVQDVKDLTGYNAVVLGSAIQRNEWLPEGVAFAQTFQAELARLRCAIFTVCITMSLKNGAYGGHIASSVAPVRALVCPLSEGLFAGVLDIAKIPDLVDRIRFRLSVAMGIWQEGDHRDWNAIRAWAEGLRPLLLSQPKQPETA